MKEWLRVLPFPILIFCVLTFLDIAGGTGQIRWIFNISHAVVLGAIGCVGQYLIHKNILQSEDEEEDGSCISCGKPE